jgi:hypothetical protein
VRAIYNDDWYFDFMVRQFRKAGLKPDTFCEVPYCWRNRTSEKYCPDHKENQWAL